MYFVTNVCIKMKLLCPSTFPILHWPRTLDRNCSFNTIYTKYLLKYWYIAVISIILSDYQNILSLSYYRYCCSLLFSYFPQLHPFFIPGSATAWISSLWLVYLTHHVELIVCPIDLIRLFGMSLHHDNRVPWFLLRITLICPGLTVEHQRHWLEPWGGCNGLGTADFLL